MLPFICPAQGFVKEKGTGKVWWSHKKILEEESKKTAEWDAFQEGPTSLTVNVY